mmetsp:Transcript_116032/g.231278  ORF Transcript_116032/g.231278 Transcript_116032/m.231278 type:complete len:216 (-) Transcript_116032:487-1134(-)
MYEVICRSPHSRPGVAGIKHATTNELLNLARPKPGHLLTPGQQPQWQAAAALDFNVRAVVRLHEPLSCSTEWFRVSGKDPLKLLLSELLLLSCLASFSFTLFACTPSLFLPFGSLMCLALGLLCSLLCNLYPSFFLLLDPHLLLCLFKLTLSLNLHDLLSGLPPLWPHIKRDRPCFQTVHNYIAVHWYQRQAVDCMNLMVRWDAFPTCECLSMDL